MASLSADITQSNHLQVDMAAAEFKYALTQARSHTPGPQPIHQLFDFSVLKTTQDGLFKGSYHVWLYRENDPVGIRDIEIKQNFSVATAIENCISLDFILNGGSDLELGHHKLTNNEMPRAYLSSHGTGGLQSRLHKKGDRIRGLGIWIPPEMLIKDFGLDAKLLPSNLQSMMFLEQDFTACLPLTAKVKTILTDILEFPFSGVLADQFLNAKVTELLCHTVQSLMTPEKAFCENNQLSQHKSEAISRVLRSLTDNFADPPSLVELAEQVGMSRSNLSSTFKSSYGMSISEYLLQKRMETAQSLLKEGKLPVLDVAIAVGYDDQSGFGRAYKRYYGHAPKDDRPKL
jgi:AraC-like DNA-binding protein